MPACANCTMGAQWLNGRVLDSRPKGRAFEPHRRHYVVSLSKKIYPSLVLVQPRKTRPYITERLLMGRKNQIKQTKQTNCTVLDENSILIYPLCTDENAGLLNKWISRDTSCAWFCEEAAKCSE